jgi:hypothetical protein
MEPEEGGVTRDMMDFFKSMQSGNFGMKPDKGGAQEQKPVRLGRPYPGISPAPVVAHAAAPKADKPEPAPKPKAAPTGTPKSTPVKFRPKLLKLGR